MLAAIPFPIIDPVALSLGPVVIRWYSLAYIGGILLGWLYLRHLVGRSDLWPNEPPLSRADTDDIMVWAAFGIILGGRIGYVLFYDPAGFAADPFSIFAVWRGGMSFHGGFAGTVIALILFAWRRGVPVRTVGDIVAASSCFGLFFGRIANFINGELYGRITDVPWAMVFPQGGPMPRHPSQLYEAALEGVVLFVLLRLATHRFGALGRPGLVTGLFFLCYGLFRVAVEFFRMPDSHIGFVAGGLTMGIILSLPMIPIGLGFIALARGTPERPA